MKKAVYKIVGGTNGFKEMEEEVSKMLNQGWKPIGGIAFNNSFPYQAMAKITEIAKETPKPKSASAAMKAIDDLI